MKNAYPDEPVGAERANSLPPMEDLQPRMVPSQPAGMSVPRTDTPTTPVRVSPPPNPDQEIKTVIFAIGKLEDFLQWFGIVLEVILAIRFILMLIGADPANIFASLLYGITNVVLFPFLGIVASPSLRHNQAFEFSTLIAMAIYAMVFWAARRFLHIIINRPEDSPELS
jgi:hypothetical protein